MKRRAKDFIGREVLVGWTPGFVALCDRRKGITIKRYDEYGQYDITCLNRKDFLKGPEGRAAFIEVFDTLLEWILSGQIEWNVVIMHKDNIKKKDACSRSYQDIVPSRMQSAHIAHSSTSTSTAHITRTAHLYNIVVDYLKSPMVSKTCHRGKFPNGVRASAIGAGAHFLPSPATKGRTSWT